MQGRQRKNFGKTFDEFEAAELFCPTCKRPVPVRKRLLLALPEGDKYDYYCALCGAIVGGKLDTNTDKILNAI